MERIHSGNPLTPTHHTNPSSTQTQLTQHMSHSTIHNTQPPHTHTTEYSSTAQYHIQIELHGIAKLHLHTIDLLLLRTIQHTLTPLVTHSVLGPPHEDPSDSHLPYDCHEWAIHEYVGDLCRPLTQELDATYRQFLSDLGDLNQRLLNPRELIPSRGGTFAYSYNMALRTIIHLLRDHMEPMVSSFVEAHVTDKHGTRHARRFTSSAISTLR